MAELYSKASYKALSPPSQKRCRAILSTEGRDLSSRQAQEPCGRGYLNSNRHTSLLCISCSLALVSLRHRLLSSQWFFFVPLVLCAGSFSAVVDPGVVWVGQPHPHCTVICPFVYGFSSVPVLKRNAAET